MLASTVLEDETRLTYDTQLSIVRLPAPEPNGRTIAEADIRTATGYTVVAIIREGEVIVGFDPAEFEFEADDEVVIAGTDEDVARFEHRFGI